MVPNKKIVCFSGRAHNGKTMLSDHLVDNHGFEKISVANALKKICCNLLGFPSIEKMNEEKAIDKKYVLGDADVKFLSNESGIPYEYIKEKLKTIDNTFNSVRHALQFVGTDIIRNYDPAWHVKQLEKEICESQCENIVIDDVRFQNEYEVMLKLNAISIFIMRPVLYNVLHHKSDEELNWKMFNNVIINSTTPDDAKKQLEDILNTGKNTTFEEILKYYIELDLEGKTVVTRELTNILIIKDDLCIDKFNITDNPLIIEDLKKYLKYDVCKEEEENE